MLLDFQIFLGAGLDLGQAVMELLVLGVETSDFDGIENKSGGGFLLFELLLFLGQFLSLGNAELLLELDLELFDYRVLMLGLLLQGALIRRHLIR